MLGEALKRPDIDLVIKHLEKYAKAFAPEQNNNDSREGNLSCSSTSKNQRHPEQLRSSSLHLTDFDSDGESELEPLPMLPLFNHKSNNVLAVTSRDEIEQKTKLTPEILKPRKYVVI